VSPTGGRWVEVDRPPYATANIYCTACGAMIPRRHWNPGDGKPYCNADCVRLEERVASLACRSEAGQ
jgi:hypothetical protein